MGLVCVIGDSLADGVKVRQQRTGQVQELPLVLHNVWNAVNVLFVRGGRKMCLRRQIWYHTSGCSRGCCDDRKLVDLCERVSLCELRLIVEHP